MWLVVNVYFYGMDNQLSLFGFEEPVEPQPSKSTSRKKTSSVEGKENAGSPEEKQEDLFTNTDAEGVKDLETAFLATEAAVSKGENPVFPKENTQETILEQPFAEEELNELVIPNKEVPTAENILQQDTFGYPVTEHQDSDTENGATAAAENPSVPESENVEAEKTDLAKETNETVSGTTDGEKETPLALAGSFGKKGRKSFKEIDAEVDLVQVPSDEVLFSKQYYPISQVAKWFRVNNSLLRFWENEFDILKPRKNRKGDRLFRPEDIKNLQIIYYLLRQKKYTIAGARKYIKNNRKTVDTNMKILQTLNDFKKFLLELKANSER